jgi:hypothetical protein
MDTGVLIQTTGGALFEKLRFETLSETVRNSSRHKNTDGK